MRIGILGAGAVGTYVGALLADRTDVMLIGRPEVADRINDRGVRISGRTEVHVRPEEAFSDGIQSLKPEKFRELIREIRPFVRAAGRKL